MSEPIIEVRGLGKRYRLGQFGARSLREELEHLGQRLSGNANGSAPATMREFWALRDVSFDVQQGEVLGVIGKNGAGKSTLLKLLSRITDPTEGDALLRGRVASLLEVGTGFHPELTGKDNIYLSGTIMGMTRGEIRSRFDEIVAFAGVEKFLETPVKRYSSGMYVRLGFAVAAHLDPEILIVDEVLAVGDLEFQRKCLGKMQDVARHGRTILFVSHNMTSVQNLCDRVLWLADGQVRQEGPTDEVIASYISDSKTMMTVPLAERVDREGGTEARFTAVDFKNGNLQPAGAIRSGEDLVIDLQYEGTEPLLQAVCAVGLYDERLSKVAHFTTQVKTLNGRETDPRGVFRCRIPNIPLNVGRYSINVSLHANGALMDRVEGVATIEVDEADVFGTGRAIPPQQGILLLDHDWEHLKSS